MDGLMEYNRVEYELIEFFSWIPVRSERLFGIRLEFFRSMQHRRSPVSAPFLVPQEKTGDEEEENEAEALSISDQRTLYLVNIFVANATHFLNSFSALCQEKLSLVHRKILRLDASLSLLESKLSSVQEEPSGIPEASHQTNDNVVMLKGKSVVPDEPSDVECSSSEPSKFVGNSV